MNLLSSLLTYTARQIAALRTKDASQDTEISGAKGRLTTAESNISTLTSRIETAISAVTTDTEVTDIRVGDDRVTYGTAGTAVRTQFSQVKSDIMNIAGSQSIPKVADHYYNIGANTTTVDVANPSVSATGFACSSVSCSEGDEFVINATGASTARTYAFVDSGGNILYKSGSTYDITGAIVVAPKNSAYMVINDNSGRHSYYNRYITGKVDDLYKSLSVKNVCRPIPMEFGSITLNTASIDITNVQYHATLKHAVVACQEGDEFTINCTASAAGAPRCYAFIKSDGTRISVSNVATVSNEVIVAPALSAYLVINDQGGIPSYIGVPAYIRLNNLENVTSVLHEVNESFVKGASNYSANYPFTIEANEKYILWWEASEIGSLAAYTRATENGANLETIEAGLQPNRFSFFTATYDANFLRIVATKSGTVHFAKADSLPAKSWLVEKEVVNSKEEVKPLVEFNYSHMMSDVSDVVSDIQLTTDNRDSVMDKVYELFGELAVDNPNYITEILDATSGIDGDTPTGLSYPWYASDGVVAGSTHDIPIGDDETISYTFEHAVHPYNIRLYKLSDVNSQLSSDKKKKLFVVCGLHGNEVVAPINAYILAKELCENISDADLLKLRASYDIYIIPYLNGFGCQSLARVNGNLTDINRNFPTSGWAKTTVTEDTFANLATCTFSGVSSGSEFETQLVMALYNQIQPDVYIDHHNSGTSSTQFYSIGSSALIGNLIYQATADCSSAFVLNMPEYFGRKYKWVGSNSSSPAVYAATNGQSVRWAYESGLIAATTCEVFEAINFINGNVNPSPTKYTADAFSVSEYTLRNMILHLCDYAMKQ